MRRFLVVAMALSLCVGFAALAVANTKKVSTKVSINFKAGSATAPYTQDVFSGEVKAKKGCKKGRKITLNGPSSGSTKSSSNGSWSISTNAASGTYSATAKKKVIKKKHGKIVCKKGTSPTITVE